MIKRNLKFHLMAVGGIVLGVLLAFYFSGQFDASRNAADVVTISPYRILIQEASWGENCTSEIHQKLSEFKANQRSLQGDAYKEMQQKIDDIGELPSRNNAYDLVSRLCGGMESCHLSFSEDSIPYKSTFYCRYKLNISFMCHKYDIIRDASMEFGQSLNIDCLDPENLPQSLTGSEANEMDPTN